MEPTQAYFRAKRGLLIFSIVFLFQFLSGISLLSGEQVLFGIKIVLESGSYFDIVLLLGVFYFIFQTSIFWFAQNSDIKASIHYKTDFFSTVLFGIGTLSLFVGIEISKLLTNLSRSIVNIVQDTNITLLNFVNLAFIEVIFGSISAVLSMIVLYATLYKLRILQQKRKNKLVLRDQKLIEILMFNKWELNYNPKHPSAKKNISFSLDGSIGRGQNANEATWLVKNNILEIKNSKDLPFSRFIFNDDEFKFHHTNDEDTLSIRNQTINLAEN